MCAAHIHEQRAGRDRGEKWTIGFEKSGRMKGRAGGIAAFASCEGSSSFGGLRESFVECEIVVGESEALVQYRLISRGLGMSEYTRFGAFVKPEVVNCLHNLNV